MGNYIIVANPLKDRIMKPVETAVAMERLRKHPAPWLLAVT
jgi:hypothetical protein